MCGIAGIVSQDHRLLAPLRSMTEALRHRGPDDEGYLLAETASGRAESWGGPDTPASLSLPILPVELPAWGRVGLSHRRLAIQDLSPLGHGPMGSADGRLWLTYNGEVYDFHERAAELRSLGHTFRSRGDTEVVLEAWRRWGEDCLPRFNGMWAFAVYDAERGLLWCARDRFGIKPLYYYRDQRLFAFASEIKALLAHPAVPRRIDDESLGGFLLRGAIDEGSETFFEGIRALPPGHRLRLDLGSGRLDVERWYAPPRDELGPADPAQLRALLEDSVRLRLRSDVDVGSCLSGGLDSSTLVCLTARLRDRHEPRAHRTFSVAYPDPELSEAAHVDAVVALTGVEAARTTPTAERLAEELARLAFHQDEPFPSSAVYSQWCVMALAGQVGMKVLLDGQGADEVLGGYHYHHGPYLAEVWGRDGVAAAWAAARALSRGSDRPLIQPLALMAYHLLPLPMPVRSRLLRARATQPRLPGDLLIPELAARANQRAVHRHAPRRSLLEERLAAISRSSLPALLRYEDRNSMAFSIEARLPFLDYRVVEWGLARPSAQLMAGGFTKAPLREAVAGLVPDSIRWRRDKLGFASPERRFLTGLAPQVRGWLGAGARTRDFVDPRRLEAWLRLPDASLAARPGLWRLLSTELWLRSVVGTLGAGAPPSAPGA
jgi:asparagine synthase (glutamine-hydrolysing)